ncbi:MAG: RNA polymerase sigma factor [Flavobacteriales bacterium]
MKPINYDQISDEDLVRRVVDGYSEEFSFVYDRYSHKVYSRCLSFAKGSSTAQDLTHDIFIKAFINLSKFNYDSRFSTWLYSITYNYCIDFVKQLSRVAISSEEEVPEIPESDDNKNQEELLKIEAHQLQLVLDMLHPKDKAILLMKYQDSMSIKEIQEALDLNESAVKMRIKRARAKTVEFYNQYIKS